MCAWEREKRTFKADVHMHTQAQETHILIQKLYQYAAVNPATPFPAALLQLQDNGVTPLVQMDAVHISWHRAIKNSTLSLFPATDYVV